VELGCWGACVEHFIDFTDENYKRKSLLAKHNPFWYTVKIGAFKPNVNTFWVELMKNDSVSRNLV
jgi:hypothetical protein